MLNDCLVSYKLINLNSFNVDVWPLHSRLLFFCRR